METIGLNSYLKPLKTYTHRIRGNGEDDDGELKKIITKGENLYGFDAYEQLGKIADSAQAAIKGHAFIDPMGHDDPNYSDTYEAQLNEIIAHCSENLWVGNPVFKQIAPGLYEKMRDLMKRKLGLKP